MCRLNRRMDDIGGRVYSYASGSSSEDENIREWERSGKPPKGSKRGGRRSHSAKSDSKEYKPPPDWTIFDGPPKKSKKTADSSTTTGSQIASKRGIEDDDCEGSSTSRDSNGPGKSKDTPAFHEGWISRYTFDPTQDFPRLQVLARSKDIEQGKLGPFVTLSLSQQPLPPAQTYRPFSLKKSNANLFKWAGKPVESSSKKRNAWNPSKDSGENARQISAVEPGKKNPYVRTMIVPTKATISTKVSEKPVRQESREVDVARRKAIPSSKEPNGSRLPNASRETTRQAIQAARPSSITSLRSQLNAAVIDVDSLDL